ncbi:hypothetical protein H1Q63_28895 [Desmonostoc muscorum CCALA 125]|nr:hypothetical protein [Desmonostoc muscorum CCALA 125]
MKSNKPFVTPNPQDFMLRIVWSVDASSKMVAELSNARWLPRIGETLILPVDETGRPNSWRKFKVLDVVYDFQNQIVRVLCSPINWTPPNPKTLIQKIEEPRDKWEVWEKAFATSEATMKDNEPERQFGLGHELYPVDEEDDELEKLKSEIQERIRRSLE